MHLLKERRWLALQFCRKRIIEYQMEYVKSFFLCVPGACKAAVAIGAGTARGAQNK